MSRSMKSEWDEFTNTSYYRDMIASDPSMQRAVDMWNKMGTNESYFKTGLDRRLYSAYNKWKSASAADATARESYLAATSKSPGRSATILSSLNNGPKTLLGSGPVDLSKTVLG